jgi:hypothetical protein
MNDEKNDDDDDDDGWQILKPGVILFETTIWLVEYLILAFFSIWLRLFVYMIH